MVAVVEQNAQPEARSGAALETFQPGEVFGGQGGCGFDLNTETISRSIFDNHIDLCLVLIPVVMKAERFVYPGRLLAQFGVDKRLQQRTELGRLSVQPFLGQPAHGAGHARVDSVQLRSLDQPFILVGVPRRKLLHQKEPFKQCHVFLDGLTVQRQLIPQLGEIDEFPRVERCQLQQPGHRIGAVDVGEVSNISLNQGIDVLPIPGATASFACALRRFWKAPLNHALQQIIPDAQVPCRRCLPAQQLGQEGGFVAPYLAFRQRRQLHRLHPSREGV